jgi:hypothetical protein
LPAARRCFFSSPTERQREVGARCFFQHQLRRTDAQRSTHKHTSSRAHIHAFFSPSNKLEKTSIKHLGAGTTASAPALASGGRGPYARASALATSPPSSRALSLSQPLSSLSHTCGRGGGELRVCVSARRGSAGDEVGRRGAAGPAERTKKRCRRAAPSFFSPHTDNAPRLSRPPLLFPALATTNTPTVIPSVMLVGRRRVDWFAAAAWPSLASRETVRAPARPLFFHSIESGRRLRLT